MDRRSFLLSFGAATLSQGLMGCRRNVSAALQVDLLAHSLPSQLVSKFRSQVESEAELKLSLVSSSSQLFENLLNSTSQTKTEPTRDNLFQSLSHLIWGPPPKDIYRLTSLGDYWLSTAIDKKLIRPWSVEQMSGLKTLTPQWQNLVHRDRQGKHFPNGEIWGAPYRWGATVIAFRKDKFRELGWTPTDWSDLWRPELKDKISVLDQPREVIGLTLKKLNRSYNTSNLSNIANLQAELKALDQQAKLYSSTDYLQPLIFGDTWAAVGWSTDILPILREEPDIGAVVPKSGTALWSDIWVLPKIGPDLAKIHQQWIEFWWEPEMAQKLSQFTDALSPALQTFAPEHPTVQLLSPKQPWFEQSEFLEPLSPEAIAQYQQAWQTMRA
jgi:putative spermidine/putrescine transport system substrate-binding protein